MYKITEKQRLNDTVVRIRIQAPFVAAKAEPGQFIILRVSEDGERIPLTIAGFDRMAGTVDVIYQIVGATTYLLDQKQEGDSLADFVGPLGNATVLEGKKEIVVVGGGVGCAIALPVAQKAHRLGIKVHSIVGFRSKELLILEKEFAACSDTFTVTTDDGSFGRQGRVTEPLKELLESHTAIDEVLTIGPLIMMKFVVETARPFGVPVTVSMNPIMIDGTGMCGGCRLSVGGKVCFACVDGPEFDGYQVNFDEAMMRGATYREFERHAYEKACNLFAKEVK